MLRPTASMIRTHTSSGKAEKARRYLCASLRVSMCQGDSLREALVWAPTNLELREGVPTARGEPPS